MQKQPSVIIILFFLSAIFFFLGFFSFAKFYNIVLPDMYGLKYQMDLAAVGDTQTMFSIVISIIPVSLFFTWQLIPLYSADKKLSTIFIVVICMLLATYIRYKILVSYFDELVQSITNKNAGPSVQYAFNELNFEYYLAAGLLGGCVISYLLFHNSIKRQ